ncbi:hypothetical protein HYFRA_00002047 [Hymenoscyphus fraxineus]|uniref:Uncharacterized protein n=1 Tax=Hymenoscyphus fraxineus TaxID=746836 RepID=A0A9N9PMG7_9HELO|nr:hypothetical protein HYFRA_00002047 [Hymenoscyphus fraxineus]
MSKAIGRETLVSEEVTGSEVQLISTIQPASKVHPGYKTLLAKTPTGIVFVSVFEAAFAQAAERSHVQVRFNVTPTEAMEEFRRLIALKVFMKDTYAMLLSPTPIMDAVWHEVILDTKTYASLQTTLGRTLHHRPEGASDAEKDAREIRLATMEAMYVKYFGDKPLTERDDPSRSTSPGKGFFDQRLANRAKVAEQPEIQSGKIRRLVVRETWGNLKYHGIDPDSCIYTEIWKVVGSNMELERGRSANEYALSEEDTVDIILKPVGIC